MVVGPGRHPGSRDRGREPSFRTAIRESNKVRGRQSWSKYIRSAKAPELPVILLEDFAALVGLIFALFGVGMTTHNGIFDVIGTVMIGLLLVAVAIALAIETKSLLLGEAASLDAIARIEGAPDHHTWRRADHPHEDVAPRPGGGAVATAVGPQASAAEVSETINRAEINIREAEPMVTALYLEPDIYDPNHVPAPRPERPAAPATELLEQLTHRAILMLAAAIAAYIFARLWEMCA